MSAPKPLILVDGSSYLYRAFYALPPLTNSKGQATGAVYGVITMLKKLKAEYEPEFMAVVFDAKGKTFRDELFAQYKAHRPPMPDELRSQIQPLQTAVKALGFPLIIEEGVEADDVIATLAITADQQKIPVLISTGDKDIAQIVNANITCINTMNNTLLDIEGVIKKFGVKPEQIGDYLSLIGDKSDNIPGIPGVGPKTAMKWLQEYHTIENLLENTAKIKGKIAETLLNHREALELSRKLVTLKLDVPLAFAINDLILKTPDNAVLKELFTELEFKSFLNEIIKNKPQQENSNYQTILTNAQFQELLTRLHQAEFFAFDTETTSLNYINAEIVGLSFAFTAHEAFYLPVAHHYLDAPTQLNREEILAALKPILTDNKRKKIIGQNLKYDKNVLKNHGIELTGILADTMLESYVLNSASSRHDMDTLAFKHLGHQTIRFEEVAGKGAKQKTFDQVEIAAATHYAAEDADVTLQLHQHFQPQLAEQPSLTQIYQEIELPLISVLSKMECRGVLIDKALLAQQSKELTKRLQILSEKAYDLAGEEFNLNSSKQLQNLLYEKLKLPILQKTPKGQASTAEPVLQELAQDYPLPKLILEYRSLSKLKSTYTDALPQQINSKTRRVHTSYNQAITATGRLSSTDPNLQNIPIRHEEGKKIRCAFIAPEGYKILAADYSQIELRIMAHLSNDAGLLSAFAKGLDIHKATAAEVFGVSLDQVTFDQRRKAKAINFGLIYGMSHFGLAKQINTGPKVAQGYIELYFERYPGVKQYMQRTRELAAAQGYVETIFGRRLYLPQIQAKNFQERSAAERAAINAPMQGSAADIIKRAMLKLDDYLTKNNSQIYLIMQVHDELIFEVPGEKIADFSQTVKHLMEADSGLNVPLLVQIGIGDNWDEAH